MPRYIDRETALSFPFANGRYDPIHANEHFILGCESYKDWLEALPTADVVEARRGKWLINTDGYHPYCSECKLEPQGRIMTDFCPNCGADMRGKSAKEA